MNRRWLTEHRYRAVLKVLDGGVPVTQAAVQYGTSRQSLYNWLRRYEADGLDGLSDRSRRPRSSPTRLAAELEAAICELRQSFPRWGARRISHELAARGMAAPGRTTVHRVLARNGLVTPQEQQHARKYKRWALDLLKTGRSVPRTSRPRRAADRSRPLVVASERGE